MYFRQLANKSSFLLQFTKCSILGVFILVNQSYKSKVRTNANQQVNLTHRTRAQVDSNE